MAEFEGKTNRTICKPGYSPFVQIRHEGVLYRVNIFKNSRQLHKVKTLDDGIFGGHQGISLSELRLVSQNGRVLGVLEGKDLVGESQLLLNPIRWYPNMAEDEAHCYGTGVSVDYRGTGIAQVLFKAQEVTAREAGKSHMSLTVRLENAASIRARLQRGFRITGYNPNCYGPVKQDGARLIMVKDFLSETTPYAPDRLRRLALSGEIPILYSPADLSDLPLDTLQVSLPVLPGDIPDRPARNMVSQVLNTGYIGIGLLKPEEYGSSDKNIIIFHKKDTALPADKPEFSPLIQNEFDRLKEVLVSYGAQNHQINVESAINAVAQQNIGNVDTIARQEEYLDFVRTLEQQGVRVLRTHAQIPKSTHSPVFTRDPSVVIGDTVIIGKLGREQRQYETSALKEVFVDVKHLDLSEYPDAVIEGGDIIQLDDKTVLVGLGQRTNENGLRLLQNSLPGYEFVQVSHPDLHLDVLFTMVGKKMALADTTKLAPEFVELIESKGIKLIIADPAEQEKLGCNVLAIDNYKVISVAENKETNRRLKEAGIEVIEVSMPNVIKSGGGPRCMTCPIRRDSN